MITVVSTMQLESNAEQEWDRLIRERFKSAHNKEGWIHGQLLTPADAPGTRVILAPGEVKRTGRLGMRIPPFSPRVPGSTNYSMQTTGPHCTT